MIQQVKNSQFAKSLFDFGDVFIVGGAVRDTFLRREFKDIDLVVTEIPQDKLIEILNMHGRVELVGQSFGVIKFFPNEFDIDEPIDISLPRIEKSTGPKHTDFEIIASHDIDIKEDLGRRDFTINSIAIHLKTGHIVDPFNGIGDRITKQIRLVNDTAFEEDPLRMLRAIQFASRLNFDVELVTMQKIIQNSHLIRTISGERILIELDKIWYKAKTNKVDGLKQFISSNLFFHFFDYVPNLRNKRLLDESIKIRADFYYHLLNDECSTTGFAKNQFIEKLRGDTDTAKQIDLIRKLDEGHDHLNWLKNSFAAYLQFEELQMSGTQAGFKIRMALKQAKEYNLPLCIKEMDINGDDLISLGFQGKQIGILLNTIFDAILCRDIPNKKENILGFIKQQNNVHT